jgi:hypothetical protein
MWVKMSTPQPPPITFSVWPIPTSVKHGAVTAPLDAEFSITTNTPSPQLQAAIERITALIFTHAVNASTAAAAPVALPSLLVTVRQAGVPLQLGVDESYSLDIPSDATSQATLTADTVYGAYHGLQVPLLLGDGTCEF